MKTILTFLACFCMTLHVYAQLKVYSGRCNDKTNPLGVDLQNIHFSWEMISNENNQKQTGYQLVIASSAIDAESGKYDVYNSGFMTENQNIYIFCKGLSLRPATTYYWKVRVWGRDKKSSDWSNVYSFTTGLFSKDDWAGAVWIAYENSLRKEANGQTTEILWKKTGNPYLVSPLFQKEFNVSKKVKQALLFVSGLGQYEGSINGKKISHSFLTPGWSGYDKTVFYNTYEVSNLIKDGENVLGFILGNGFYNTFQERYSKVPGNGYGVLKLICRLKIEYQDGSQENVVSNDSWKTCYSPITFNNIYGGEDVDARLEQPSGHEGFFNANPWRGALETNAPKGKLVGEYDYPVVFKDTILPQRVVSINPGIYVYDFGQNASGIVQLKVNGLTGHRIKIYPSELLTRKGTVTQENTGAPYYYTYTLKGGGEEIFQPRFTYYGFRFVQVEGAVPDTAKNLFGLPVITGLKMLHNTSSQPQDGSFTCSNELYNRIYRAIHWAMESNLQSISTDCPHREKLGWQEQNNLMGGSIRYNFDIENLFQKIVADLIDAQHEDGMVPNIAPEYMNLRGNMLCSVEWGSSAVILPWFLYKWYDDKNTMQTAFPMMRKYIAYLENRADDLILSFGLGDWCDLRVGKKLLTPRELTATATFYRDVELLGKMASVLGYKEDAEKYRKLSDRIKTSFNAHFFNTKSNTYATGSQTSMAMPLYLGLVNEKNKAEVLKNLVDSIAANNKALTGGDVGFYYLVKTLYQNGEEQLLFDMTNRDDVPGYGYMLKQGATALTETWNGNEISRDHLMLGHIMEWFFEGIGGISQDKNSIAYRHIIIRPQPVGDLTFAKTRFHSPSGWISTDWKMTNNSFKMQVEIPVNAIATVYLPTSSNSKIYENGKLLNRDKRTVNVEEIDIQSGSYLFEVK